jgi:hypothetical protein
MRRTRPTASAPTRSACVQVVTPAEAWITLSFNVVFVGVAYLVDARPWAAWRALDEAEGAAGAAAAEDVAAGGGAGSPHARAPDSPYQVRRYAPVSGGARRARRAPSVRHGNRCQLRKARRSANGTSRRQPRSEPHACSVHILAPLL